MVLIADEQPAMWQALRAAGLTSEMQREPEEARSISLRCDPTASHYLKLPMDSIYGGPDFQN